MQLFKRKNKTKTTTTANTTIETTPETLSINKNNVFKIDGKNYFISDVKCTEHRQFYDSTWKVFFTEVPAGITKTFELVRYDTETKENLVSLLNKIHSVEELLSLNEKGKIFYD